MSPAFPPGRRTRKATSVANSRAPPTAAAQTPRPLASGPCRTTPTTELGEVPTASTWRSPSRRWPARSPTASAWCGGDRRFTFAQIAERSRRLASYLTEQGLGVRTERRTAGRPRVGPGPPRPSLYNGNEYLEGMVGSYRARVAPFNVNYRYVGEELRYLLSDAAPRALVYHATLAPVLAEVLADAARRRGPAPGRRRVGQRPAARGGRLRGGPGRRVARTAPPSSPRPTTSTSSTPAGPPACPRACSGASTTSSWRPWEAAPTGPGSSSRATSDLAARAPAGRRVRLGLLPPLMHGAAQWAALHTVRHGRDRGASPTTPAGSIPPTSGATVERERVNTISVVGDAMVRPALVGARPRRLRHRRRSSPSATAAPR